LAGTVADRPEDEALNDVIWTACAEWANFQPVLGQSKIHQEKLWTPDEFAHVFQEDIFAQIHSGATEFQKIMIITHLLGLAPEGWVAEPDKRA
jgi:hypothetical protein